MTGWDAAAAVFGGLGLFFIGIRELSASLQRLAGRRMRALMAQAAAGPVRAAVTGAAIGIVTQSSNAATFVTTGLMRAGLLPIRSAVVAVAWSNVGPAALVLLTTIDLRLAALWLLGCIGFTNLLGYGSGPKIKPLLGAVLALAFAFLGLSILKSSAALIQTIDPSVLRGGWLDRWLAPPFAAGLLIALVMQSSSTPTILAAKLAEAGLLNFDQLAFVVYGASLGSGLALLVAGRELRGTARQLLLFQALLKSIGAALFVGLFVIERWGHVPLALHAALALGHTRGGSIAVLFLLIQLVTCVVVMPFRDVLARLAARLAPPTQSEELSRPLFLYPQALDDPPTALHLVAKEVERLVARLSPLLDPVREGAPADGPSHDTLMESGTALEEETRRFLGEVLTRTCPPDVVAGAVRLDARLDLLRSLRETLGEFGTLLTQVRDDEVHEITRPLAESLHFLLVQLAEAQEAEDAATVRALTEDRGELMEAIRRQTTVSGHGLAYAPQDQVFRATTLFERAVWLVRRLSTFAPTGAPPGAPTGS